MSLRKKTFRAVRWTAIAAVARIGFTVSQIAVLARLLSPEDYGLMAMVTVVLSVAAIVTDLGLNSAFLQRRDVSPEARSSLFWASIFASLVLSALLIIMAPVLVLFFEEPRLTPVIWLSTLTLFISATGQQIRLSAQKELNFGVVVATETVSAAIGFSVAVVLAYSGFGVYALVLASVASACALSVFSWVFIANGWRPLWRFRWGEIKPYLNFGGAVMGSGVVRQLHTSLDLLIGGRMLEASVLGVYSMPRTLLLQIQFLINPILTRVGFPLVAEVQHDTQRVKNIYLKTLNMTASVNAPLYLVAAFFSNELVLLFLGEQWLSSVDILTILAMWGLIRSFANPSGSLVLGVGRAGLAFAWNICLLILLLPALIIGSSYGSIGISYSLLLFQSILFIPCWYILVRPICHASIAEYIAACLKPVLLALLSVIPAKFAVGFIDVLVVHIALGVAVFSILYFALSSIFNKDWLLSILQLLGVSKY